MNQWLKDNVLVLLGICGIAGAAYIEWRIMSNVQDAVNNAGSITPDQLAIERERIKANAAAIAKLEVHHDQDATRIDGKVERIVDILLEP